MDQKRGAGHRLSLKRIPYSVRNILAVFAETAWKFVSQEKISRIRPVSLAGYKRLFVEKLASSV
jgi:hypothetical protein